ncbi:CHASE3 domain-containing protein [Sphingobium sp.]|uniref:CHASE3 domain-containing protein n=1 Tax=Sphingobium sp. TaxID=1912891 RepID=UPI003BB5F6FF
MTTGRRRFLAIALLVPIVLAGFALWLGAEFSATDRLTSHANASFDRATRAASLIAHVSDAEASQRGFVLTGDERFLAPYFPARRQAEESLAKLAGRFADSPDQNARLETLSAVVSRKFREMDGVIAERRNKGLAAAIARVKEGDGRKLMDIIRTRAEAMLMTEEGIRVARVAAYNRHAVQMQTIIWIAVGIVSMVLAAGMFLLWRQRLSRHLAQVEAYDSAARNRAILDSTIDALIIVNPSGSIESVNPAAERMLGYSAGELERRDLSILLTLADGKGTFHERIGLIDGVLRDHFLPDREVRHKDGHQVAVDIAMGTMRVPGGDHVIASLRDISARRRAEALKDEFISTVSHELRTPLTSVVGALGLLRGGQAGALPATATRLIEIAENNSRRLIRLINDMLDIDRLQSGRLQVERVPIDLRQVVTRACEGSEGLAGVAHVRIDALVPDEPVMVSGDAERLLQVVTNIVSNAIRAAPPGSAVTIGCWLDEEGSKAQITVDDEGPGVPHGFRDRIFGRFERADVQDGVGTGLGLAISQEIMHRHDGRIWFEDRSPKGTRFAFELDVLRPVPEHAAGGESILICENDPDMVGVLCDMVSAIGFTAHCVGSAAQAREALEKHSYSALLLDLNLPDENGLNFAHRLYSEIGYSVMPVIIVSGQAREGLAQPIPFDIVEWIEKPVDPRRLESAIELALRPSSIARPTILHLDDDRDVLEITAAALGPTARVLRASDLATARALIQSDMPDVVILDLHLAQGSGLDLLPMLIDHHGRAIPTILYSAHDVGPDAARMVDAVLIKSRGSFPDLRATIRRVLDRHDTDQP